MDASKELGLSRSHLAAIMAGSSVDGSLINKELAGDESVANNLGITGTPFFVIEEAGRRPFYIAGGAILDFIKT